MTSTPHRVQRRRSRGWELPPDTVIVTRPSEWGNPFRISKATEISPEKGKISWTVESDSSAWFFAAKEAAQFAAVQLFRARVAEARGNDRYRERARLVLKGKNLACWCRADQPCHADVLLELVNS